MAARSRLLPAEARAKAAAAGLPFRHDDGDRAGTDQRLLVFADRYGASQQISFVLGLARARQAGRVAVHILDEEGLAAVRESEGEAALEQQLAAALRRIAPTAIVFSRFADQQSYASIGRPLRALAPKAGRVLHLDDNFFAMPPLAGIDRYRRARNPRRVHTLAAIGRDADLILASTPILARQLADLFGSARIAHADPFAHGVPFTQAWRNGRPTIGYFGSATHERDLAMIAPALRRVRERFAVGIELRGSVARGGVAKSLADIARIEPVNEPDYGAFRARLRTLNWDIGVAPLIANPFNAAKTPIKWNEYAQAGIAVVASRAEPYLDLGRQGALALARPDEWEARLTELIEQPDRRATMVATANRLLAAYDSGRAETALLGLLQRAASARRIVAGD
jgi:hypothetical protein